MIKPKFKYGDVVTHCDLKKDVVGVITGVDVRSHSKNVHIEEYKVQFHGFSKTGCLPSELTHGFSKTGCLPSELTLYEKAITPRFCVPRFCVDESVFHMKHGFGHIVENVSNECAEVYRVKFNNVMRTCSTNFLTKVKREGESIMEKAKLTKSQYDAIKSLEYNALKRTGKAAIVECHVRNSTSWTDDQAGLRGMSLDKLIRALYIGYEVELTKEEQVREIIKSFNGGSEVSQWVLDDIKSVYEGDN